MAYIYQADVWCDECGEKIIAELTAEGKAPENLDDESSFDSDEFPKRYDAENEESDGPENCADGRCAGDYGTFLQNQLTSEGYSNLKKMLDEHGETLPDAVKEWADYYQFEYFKQPYSHAAEWLEDHISYLAKEVNGSRWTELVSLTRDLASKLDGDTIQDLFQSNMDSDEFFKESGWYSPEMYRSSAHINRPAEIAGNEGIEMKRSAAHQAQIDAYQAENREKLAYHNILTAIVTSEGKWGKLTRVGSAYDRGDSWVWQIAFTPQMRDAVIMETFDSRVNGGNSVRCFYLDDARRQFEGRSFDGDSSEAKLQALYFHAVELWRVELNR